MVDTSSRTTSAYTVQIGNFVMNIPSGPYPDEDHEETGLGQPNPTRISWSKNYEIATHKIPSPAWKTMQSSEKTLWNLDLDFIVLEKQNMENIQSIVDARTPQYIRTFFKQAWMYIVSFTATCDAGYEDARWNCSMKFLEVND